MKVLVVSFLLCAIVSTLAAPSDLDNHNIESNEIEPSGSWERLARMMSSCATGKEDMVSCIAVKGVTAINRAARMQEIPLFTGVHFERDSSSTIRDGKSLESENEIVSSLPAEASQKTARLMSLFMDAASNFLQSQSLQVKLAPEELATAARTFSEARGKLKKLMGPILLGVGVKVLAILAIFGGGLFLLVTKALIVAKLAFILASILGFSKLFSGGSSLLGKVTGGLGSTGSGISNGGWPTGGGYGNTGWSSGAGNGEWNKNGAAASPGAASYPYARSIETDAQQLAYSGQQQ